MATYDVISALEIDLASISESIPVDDSGLSVRLVYLPTFSDNASTLVDSVNAVLRIVSAFSETLPLNESASALMRILTLTSEDLGLTDLTFALEVFRSPISDDQTASFGETFTGLLVDRASFSDNWQTDDAVSALSRLIANPSDSVVVSDLIAALEVYNAQFSENNSANLTELVYALEVYLASLTDNVPFSDSAAFTAPVPLSISDVFISNDTLSALEVMLAVFSDSFSPADLSSALYVFKSSISDDSSMSLADLVIALAPIFITMSDAVPTSDTSSAILRMLLTSLDSFSPSDSASAFEPYLGQISDDSSSGLSDTLLARFVYRVLIGEDISSVLADLVLAQLLSRVLTFSFSDDVSIELIDSVKGLLRLKILIAEQVDYADLVNSIQRILAAISETFSPDDKLAALETLLSSPSDSLSASDIIQTVHRLLGGLSDSGEISDNLLCQFRFKAVISDDVSSQLIDLVVASLVSSLIDVLSYSFSDDISLSNRDSLAVIETICANLNDQLNYSDVVDAAVHFLAMMNEVNSAEDSISALQTFLCNISESIPFSDTLAGALAKSFSLSDDVGSLLADALIASLIEAIPSDVGMELTIVIEQIQRSIEQGIPIDRTVKWRYKYRSIKETEH